MPEAIAELALSTSEPELTAPRRSIAGFLSGMGKKSFWVLVDQAVVSIGNFATTIVVGNGVVASQFGDYGMLMESYLFFNSLQSALIVYPLSVRGAVLDKEALKRMASVCLLLTLILCVPLSLGMAGTAIIFHQSNILLWVCISMIIAQIQETLRRTLLAHLQFRDAIPGDAISYLFQAAILFALLKRGELNLTTAFLTIGGTSALGAIVQAVQIGLRPVALHNLREVAADFWKLGRWILFSNVATLVGSLGYNWTLALRWGTTQVAWSYVIISPMKLVNPLMVAMGSLIIPTVSRLHHTVGVHRAKIVGVKYAALGFVLLLPYLLLILILPEMCIHILFRHRPEYAALANFLRIFVLTYALSYIGNVTLACSSGLGNSRANFIAMVANSIISVTVALPMVYWLGLKGIILGGLIATATYALFAVYQLIRYKDPPPATGLIQT